MNWQQLIVEPGPERLEAVEAWLNEAGALAITLQDAGDAPVLEPAPGETPLWPEVRLIALFDEDADLPALANGLREALGDEAVAQLAMESLENRVWELEWRRDYRPMRFGRRLWVSPPDALHETPADAVTVVLEPGLAFGTGTHPTTALCLRWLDAHPPQGRDVLDYGCGSGVLAVAAALLGAGAVVATDIDPQALQSTRDNAARNAVSGILTPAPHELPAVQHDLVLANILAGTLRHLAPELAARTKAGGDLVLSGVLREQHAEVAACYREWFDLSEPAVLGDWCLLHGVRRRDPGATASGGFGYTLGA